MPKNLELSQPDPVKDDPEVVEAGVVAKRMEYVSLHSHSTLCQVEWCGIGRPPKPWCERFFSKIVLSEDGCWLWNNVIGRPSSDRNRLNFAPNIAGEPHAYDACRWIYEQTILRGDKIPKGLQLDHICENWWCVHPYHLYPVTNLENNQRYRETRSSWTLRDRMGRFAGRKELPNGVR